ncbi:hypothetical protein BG015_008562 [Linnemannia schmuckeri]|uniref:Uncharacterized protein n=1 Tax=Linnemannia schmuckeri TaxID=64567 RepID=A0A9P5VAF6_9FUNG|nr:hypothetical protein BG015_008562 [Linnemannia schmuckeri]
MASSPSGIIGLPVPVPLVPLLQSLLLLLPCHDLRRKYRKSSLSMNPSLFVVKSINLRSHQLLRLHLLPSRRVRIRAMPLLESNINNIIYDNSTSSASALNQILRGIDHITDTVTGLRKRLKGQKMSVDRMHEQMKWLMDQVDEIQTQSTSQGAHTQSLCIDAGLVEDHLGNLLQGNRKIKEQMKGTREDVGKVSPRFRYNQYQQHQDAIYRSLRY